jgi:XTP/dITP diphosphohydrolase
VFGDVEVADAEEVAANWERNKAEEKQRASVTEGVPMTQPALALAAKLAGRVRKAGLGVPVGLSAEFGTPAEPALSAELGFPAKRPETAEELGEQLLATAVAAVAAGLDPEEALRTAARRYRDRIITAEEEVARG